MRSVIKKYIHKKSFLVFDGWKASEKAVKDLGYQYAPPVNHTTGWRDVCTGFHSNDIECENAKAKGCVRKRYKKLDFHMTEEEVEKKLVTDSLLLHEYQFYVNVSTDMKDIFWWLAATDGGKSKKYIVK
jgi:hypothetical protein